MRAACIHAVSATLGRELSQKEAAGIDDRIRLHMTLLARQDREAWSALTDQERLKKAAAEAAKDIVIGLRKAQQRVSLQIGAHDRIQSFLDAVQSRKPGAMLDAISELMAPVTDPTRGGFSSVESRYNADSAVSFGRLIDAFKATDPKFFGMFEDTKGVHDLLKEIHGEDSGNARARAGAKAWADVAEELRKRYNDAGGNVGKLENWAVPQYHDRNSIGKAGLDTWKNQITPLLDRSKYLHEDGRLYSEADIGKFLDHVYDTITTDGMNKWEPGTPMGYGMEASRNSQHRFVFFKDADSWLKYQSQFGARDLWGIMTSHVRRMTRDTSLLETFGPNADHTFRFFLDKITQAEALADRTQLGKIKEKRAFSEALYDYVSGRQQVVNEKVAAFWQGLRNIQTAAKLGGVFLTAFSDEASMLATAMANKTNPFTMWRRALMALKPFDHRAREIMEAQGLGLNSMLGGLARFNDEGLGPSFTGKLANWSLHANGAERMWDARRQGLGSVLMASVARLVKEHANFRDINTADHGMLATKGITEADWKVWQLAESEDWGSGAHSVLTPKAIAAIPDERLKALATENNIQATPQALRREATTKLMGHVLEEAGMGVMDTGARQRVMFQAKFVRGTHLGELGRSTLLFKSYPLSMLTKHWSRAFKMPTVGGKAAYMAALTVGTTLIGAAVEEVRELLAGKNPQDMNPKENLRFWGRAALRGGGLSIYGDLLYSETTGYDTSVMSALAGPVVGQIEDLWKLGPGAIIKKIANPNAKVDEWAKIFRFGRGNLPFVNMWYTKAAVDHLFFNELQEWASPGYLQRMQQRAQRDFGVSYYWRPEEKLPSSLPEFSKAVNQ